MAGVVLERGLIVNVRSTNAVDGARGDDIGRAPPLVVTAQEIDRIVALLGEAIAAEGGFPGGRARGGAHA